MNANREYSCCASEGCSTIRRGQTVLLSVRHSILNTSIARRWRCSHTVVAAVSYRPLLAGSASLGKKRLSSHPVVAGAAYQPSFEGGASLRPCGIVGSSSRIGAAYRPELAGGVSGVVKCLLTDGRKLREDEMLALNRMVMACH